MQLHFHQNVEPLFILFLTLLQREEPLIHVLHDQRCALGHRIMMSFLKQSVVGEIPGKYLLCLDVDNPDNRLKHDRKREIGGLTSKTLKKLRQEQQERAIMDMCSFMLLFAIQSMLISISVSHLEIAEFTDSIHRSAPQIRSCHCGRGKGRDA